MQTEYLTERNVELSKEHLAKCLERFQTKELPHLNKLKKYYVGKHKILMKKPTDIGKPANQVVVNFCNNIVNQFAGYLVGIPVTYKNDGFDKILEVLNYNDAPQEDTLILKNALIYGRAFEVNYVDEDGKQRFKSLDPRECVPIYANDLNGDLLYVARFYKEDLLDKTNENYVVELYGPKEVVIYRSSPGFMTLTEVDRYQHFYNQCPVTVLSLNDDEESCFEQVISLQDAYNQLISGQIDDWEAFVDSYLVLKGVVADEEDLKAMKRNRVLMVDHDASAEYLTKHDGDTRIVDMLQNVKELIHKISNCPDFTDKEFMAQSGIALKYKLVSFENKAAVIEGFLKKALQKRIELISGIFNLTGELDTWRDVDIVFTRNLPTDLADITAIVNQLRGIVSQRTLLSLLPFVRDIDEEVAAVQVENELSLEEDDYDFE